MLDTWEQRVRRDGIKLTKISFPVPPKSMGDLADRLLAAITPATKVLHFCHITNLTGQIFPVKQICDEARRRGIKTVVDGAHAFAHFPVQGERPRLRLLRHQPAQVAARADRHRLPLRPAREHRVAVAADAGQRVEGERHPQVRGDRHAPGREPQRDCRGADLPRRHRHRAQGGAPALPARPLGEAPGRRTRRSGCTRTWTRRSRARSAPCRSPACRRRRSWHACGRRGGSSPRRSSTPSTKARASRRTSTRRSKRSTPSRRRWKRSAPGAVSYRDNSANRGSNSPDARSETHRSL